MDQEEDEDNGEGSPTSKLILGTQPDVDANHASFVDTTSIVYKEATWKTSVYIFAAYFAEVIAAQTPGTLLPYMSDDLGFSSSDAARIAAFATASVSISLNFEFSAISCGVRRCWSARGIGKIYSAMP